MKLKKFLILIIPLFTVISNILYFQNTYFFSPLLYKQDNITYLPFDWYKNPMSYESINFDNPEVKGKVVNSRKDIRFIYNELKKSKIIGPVGSVNRNEYNISDHVTGCLVIQSSKSGRCTVNTINWQGGYSKICVVSGMYKINGNDTTTNLYVEVTKSLYDFLKSRFKKSYKDINESQSATEPFRVHISYIHSQSIVVYNC